jgi:hypothetical protein
MTRYYFHARGPNRSIPDHQGEELDGLSAAREIAMRIIRGMASDPFHRGDYRRWAMYIKNEEGRTIVTIPFFMAL